MTKSQKAGEYIRNELKKSVGEDLDIHAIISNASAKYQLSKKEQDALLKDYDDGFFDD